MEILFPNDLLVGNKPCNSIGRGEEYLIVYIIPGVPKRVPLAEDFPVS